MPGVKDLVAAWLRGELDPAPITGLLGIEVRGAREGRATVVLEADRRHHNALGTVHGGIYCDLADVAFGIALAMQCEDDEAFAAVEIHASYFRPVREGSLTAVARVVRRGRTTAYLECEITERADLVAKVAATYLIRRP
jgi:uncharacterized protein (TIGR00369 family)